MRRSLAAFALVAAVLAGCAKEEEPAPVAAAPPPPPPVSDVALPRVAMTSGAQCLTAEELQAEQMLILHTEIMVVAMSCDRILKQPGMMAAYKDFTLRLHDELKTSQDMMEAFLARGGAKNRKRAFDTYRTELANSAAEIVRDMSARGYCRAMQERWTQVQDFDAAALAQYVAEAADRYKADYPLCTETAAVPPAR